MGEATEWRPFGKPNNHIECDRFRNLEHLWGNQNGGTLTGNTAIVVNNTVGNISTIAGGANIGTIDGNTSVTINRLNGTLGSYYGGGLGTNASNTANVTGNVETTIQTTNASFRLSTFAGGVQYGNITERSAVRSRCRRLVRISNRFVGGSFYGNIGSIVLRMPS